MNTQRSGAVEMTTRHGASLDDTFIPVRMIPAGYLFKRVAPRPRHLQADCICDVYSISSCISDDFADYLTYWQHNGFWLFDSPAIMESLAANKGLDLSGTTLFYYEVLEQEFDDVAKIWRDFSPEPQIPTVVLEPVVKNLQGYDVVTFRAGTSPECSPLSCNGLAEQLATNEHCLFSSLEAACRALEQGAFKYAEEGPYRVYAVYTV